ncbi:PL29 family lyase N-terminal domain-containing protein [Alistipes putredinis]|uniref:PL29 family lyase N-terminal domain-containing protein n=1 Tax=Alistipes putredinis TaxID=28117 RepID=UPI003AB8C9AB
MKKLLTLAVMVTALVLSSCKYDDDDIWNSVHGLEDRVAKLEELCKQINTNISSLQKIVDALQDNLSISKVEQIADGYIIHFSDGSTATIKNEKDSGPIPVIGVRKDTDGCYYWTLDGEWLTDEKENKVKAQGTDGKDGVDGEDGITPQLKIENGRWMLSMDNGKTWTDIGQATGADGTDGEDGADGKDGTNGIFKSVTEDDDNVYFTLEDDSVVTIPKSSRFRITISDSVDIGIFAGETKTIDFSVIGATEKVTIKAIGQNGWKAKVQNYENSNGALQITAPDPLTNDDVFVFAYEPTGKTTMTCINFVEGVIIVPNELIQASRDGEIIEVPIQTNISYTVSIPQISQYWISQQSTRALHNDILKFNIKPNKGDERSAIISLLANDGNYTKTIAITQEAAKTGTYTGDVVWASEEDIIAFKNEEYTIVNGNLTLSGNVISTCNISENYLSEITGDFIVTCETLEDFDGFRALKKIGGNFVVSDGIFDSFAGLENLLTIGGNFELSSYNNLRELLSFNGLNNLQTIGGFKIYARAANGSRSCYALSKLKSFEGLESLTTINGDFIIEASSGDEMHTPEEAKALSALTSFKGLNSLNEIKGNFKVSATAYNLYTALCQSLYALTSFEGLENLNRIGGDFSIYGSVRNDITAFDKYNIFGDFCIPHLSSLKGLENLQEIGGSLSIVVDRISGNLSQFLNPPLCYLISLSALENLSSIGQNITIQKCRNLSDFSALKKALSSFNGEWLVEGNKNNPTIDEIKSM